MKKGKKKTAKTSRRRPRGNRKPPILAVAVLCENVLYEKDDVASLIRLIDTFNITGEGSSLPPGVISLNMFLGFKAGEARGTRKLQIRAIEPSGNTTGIQTQNIDFQEDEQGVQVHCHIPMTLKGAGLYWFDVIVSSETMTRIPLRVNYRQQETAAHQ